GPGDDALRGHRLRDCQSRRRPAVRLSRSALEARMIRNRLGVLGAVLIAFVVVVAIAAPVAAPYDPSSQAFRRLLPPSAEHVMGTDELGRDTASRIIYGARVSLQVGGLAVA